ncbi:IS5 family transposase [Sinomicrobium oceani]|nr:IS5 family transposase [Sinomicrobium oceani]
MYIVLCKDIIESDIIPYLPKGKRGFPPTVELSEIVNSILYKLKTGVHWEHLPVAALFEGKILSYKTVFYHYRKWCKQGVWRDCWIELLKRHSKYLDLSSGDIDGSHTTAIRGGEDIGYQGRKKRRTTNALYLTDRQGLPLAMSEPIAGNHNDLYDIEVHFEEVVGTLEQADIAVDGLFINADAGFDSEKLRNLCLSKGIMANIAHNKRNGNTESDYYFDEKLYEERYAIERTNAWMDSYRSLLNRFDTTTTSWKGFNYLAFMAIALKKFYKPKKFR